MKRGYLSPPVTMPFFLLLLFLFLVFFTLFSSLVTATFQRLGIPSTVAYLLFLFSILGSFINIPVAEERSYAPMLTVREVRFFGVSYPVPYVQLAEQKVVIAVNAGGALVPLSVVIYEFIHFLELNAYLTVIKVALGIFLSAVISHAFSRPVKGLGIAVPTLVPPLTAALSALLLGGPYKPAIAYASGILGVLIGADLMNIQHMEELGAPMVSIGGAGTFDGIFLAGVIAVLLV
ncbi:DUF1614 domain-containing protein [Thermococcus sp.]